MENSITKEKSRKKTGSNIITGEKKFLDYDSYVCIPISKEKKPIISWKNLSETPKKSFKSEHNIALITGKINQITVIDIDNPKPGKIELDGMKMYEELLDKYNGGETFNTPECITQSGGKHLYFKYDPDIQTTTGVNGYSIDIRNDGGLIVAPPSIGQMGPYIWKDNKSIKNTKIIEIPQWFKEWLLESVKKEKIKKDKPIKIDYYQSDTDYIYIYDIDNITMLLDKLPTKYLNNYMDWITVTSCLKSENLKEIWDKWSKKYNNYNMENNDMIWININPKLNIYYLIVILQNEDIGFDYNIIRKTKKLNFLIKQPDCIINEKYVDSTHFNSIRTQILKSNCGTGKTTLCTRYVKNLMINKGYKILSLTVRVSLAFQQIKNFKDSGINMDLYKELSLSELNTTNNLIIQIDSITKLDVNYWKNTIIYVDEISALFSYILTSQTLKNNCVAIFNILYILLKQASYILCTDADINDLVLSYFNKIKVKYHLIENTYKNINNILAIEYDDKEVIITKMQDMLLKNNKIICCFDSKVEMDLIVQRLKIFCETNNLKKQIDNFLVYSSTDGNEKDFLQINDRWKSKNIFYTPKITIGVSFDNKIKRDVFLIARGNSINSFGYVQQISRCRNISSLHYYVIKRYNGLKFNSSNDVMIYYKTLLKGYMYLYNNKIHDNIDDINVDTSENIKLKELYDNHGATLDHNTGEWEFHDTIFNELFFIHEYYDNVLRSAPREQFRWMLEDKGYNIQYNKNTVKTEDVHDIKNEIKICNIIIKNNNDEQKFRALYNKETSLTDSEKKIRNNAIRRAKFLNIDFNKKIEKKKYEEFLINDKVFTQHYAYKLLIESDDNIDNKIASQIEIDYDVLNAKSLIIKIKLIKQLENILKIKTLDIDTKKDIEKFNDMIIVDDNINHMIKTVFRSGRKTDNKYKYWYYQLIQMYKNVLSNDFFTVIQGTKGFYYYNINLLIFEKHKSLLNKNTIYPKLV